MPRRNNRVSDADRQRIIETYSLGEDFLETACHLGVKRATAYSIIRKFQKTGRAELEPHAGGRPAKLDRESVDFLVMLIEANPCITLRELNSQLQEVFTNKPHVSISTISRSLHGNLITLKKVDNVPAERNSERVKQLRVEFAHWMYQSGLQKHRIYIDETGFNLFTKRTYGRARRGEQVNRIVGGQRGSNTTVIVAISNLVGVLYYEIHDKGINKEVFAHFLTSLQEILGQEQAILLMDNAPCHSGASEGFPDLTIKYIPPYSPFLNPIENCFSVFKAHLKHRLNDVIGRNIAADAARAGVSIVQHRRDVLRRSVHETLMPCVTQAIVVNSYEHANTYLRPALERQDIFN